MPASCGEVRSTPNVSSGSPLPSPTTGTEIVWLVVPGGNVTVPLAGWKAGPGGADPATVMYDALIVKPLGAESVTGNWTTPPAPVPSVTVALPIDSVGGASSSVIVPVTAPLASPPKCTRNDSFGSSMPSSSTGTLKLPSLSHWSIFTSPDVAS